LAAVGVRQVIRGIGKGLIGFGVLIFLFVAYQLWGTGLAESRAQDSLKSEFQNQLQSPPTTLAPETPVTAPPPPELGEAVALVSIPKIGVEKYVVEGVGVEDLKKGPGHYPDTPMPGQAGNAAIAGHRTTYGAPFYDLNDLNLGDSIMVRTREGEFRYEVQESKIVSPDEASVLDPTPDNRLTLTTCHPRYSAAERLIIVAGLATPLPPAPPVAETPPSAPPAERATLAEDRIGLSGSTAARGPAILWGALAALVLGLMWFAGHRWKRWPAYLVGIPVFLVVLFVFFENFSRLLPANM
jgi:sortase A